VNYLLTVGVLAVFLIVPCLFAGPAEKAQEASHRESASAATEGAREPDTAETGDAEPQPDQRVELNLLGQTNTGAGESRRNENVQFNLIDNNELKDLNVRLGATATIITAFEADKKYFGSEYGNAPTSPIHMSPAPTGSRAVHGRIHYTHLNSASSARTFFQVGGVKPAHENEYGFNLTAPLWNNAFFGAHGGQTRIRGQVNGNVLIPLPEERIPLTTDPETAAVVNKIFSAYPDFPPNRTDIAPRMLNTNSAQRIDNDSIGGNLDQRLGTRDQVLLRYDFLTQKVRAFQFVKGQNPDTQTRSHTARATWTRTWTPNLLTDFSAGFQRVGSLLTPEQNFIGMRVSTSSVYASLGPGNSIPIDRAQNDYQWAARVTASHGRHQWFAGADGNRRQLNGAESDAHIGHFSFNNNFGNDAITNLRLGLPSGYFKGVGHIHRGFRYSNVDAYAGDKFQVNPRLQLTLGLRWELQFAPNEVNRLNRFPYPGDFNNLAPMFSFAYRLSDRWGILRGAYGLHYGQIFTVTTQQIRFNAPLNYKLVIQNPDLLDPLGDFEGQPPGDIRSVLYDFAPDLQSPYAHEYNFSWEFSPGGDLRVQLGYVGSRAVKLLHHWYMNRAHQVPGIPLETSTIDQRRADPRYTDIRRVVNGSRGYYDAAKATVILPRAGGFSGELSYWFSKSIDLGASYTNTAQGLDSFRNRGQNEFEMHHDNKGPSRFDQPHSFLARAGWDLPYRARGGWLGAAFADWNISGVVLLKSGTPFGIQTGSDSPGFGNVDGVRYDRPDLLDPSILGRSIDHPDRSRELLPRDAFAFPARGAIRGNLGRNVFRRGPIRNVNLALAKSWRIQTEKELTLRAESVNFLNTPQFAEPGTSLTDSNFGLITNTLNEGRTFRFMLRFGF